MTPNNIVDSTKIKPEIIEKYTKPLTAHELELLCHPEDRNIKPLGIDMPVDPEYFEHGCKIQEFNGLSIYDTLSSVNWRLGEIAHVKGHRWDPKKIDTQRWRFAEGPRAIEARGYADCKGISTLAVQLVRSYGIPCRFYNIDSLERGEDGHVMIEINYNGSWVVYEPQAGITSESHRTALHTIQEYE